MTALELSKSLLARAGRSCVDIPFPPSLQEGRILLRPLVADRDGPGLFAASNGSGVDGKPGDYDPELLIWRYMFGGPYGDLSSFMDYARALQQMDAGLALCIVDLVENRPIGVATFCNHRPSHLSLELGGIWYTPRFQRSHANSQTMVLLLQHVFETLGYRRAEWKCDSENERSRLAALRLGFSFEGLFAKHMIIKGKNRDTAWYAMTDETWPAAKQRLIARLNEAG